jgi:formylglycine-generating enzyme required for sulfatase activity
MATIPNYKDGFPTTAPVMSFKPNSLGLYDMSGNVREWCEDWFSAAKANRVLRGASWYSHVRSHLRSVHRLGQPQNARGQDFGFRCVVERTSD